MPCLSNLDEKDHRPESPAEPSLPPFISHVWAAKGHRKECLSSSSRPSRCVCVCLSPHKSWLQTGGTSTADLGWAGGDGGLQGGAETLEPGWSLSACLWVWTPQEGGLERVLPAWGRLKGDDSVSTLDLGRLLGHLNKEGSCRRRNSLGLLRGSLLCSAALWRGCAGPSAD